MKKILYVILALMVSLWLVQSSVAAEHGGKEHGGKEHGGTNISGPSTKDVHAAMEAYVKEKSKATGALELYDKQAQKVRKLTLERIHERVGKTGDYYYSCADFKDMDSGETIDLDLDVEHKDGKLKVVEVRLHKVDGKERFTYDEKDNRISVKR